MPLPGPKSCCWADGVSINRNKRWLILDIRQAKQEIANTLRAYHRRDEQGNWLFPRLRQRPILLMGPPGIGKTAIMAQIAEEANVGLVAYSMTHHTRQSAVGLPRIETRQYTGGEAVPVTEYTLSEIVASVYDCMERTGKREGILFIDEINCVSETLVPTMLQFLQNKTFGNHPVPEGWMIVAAGNPPGYNRSVREFDIVTLDRLRRIDVEPQVEVWMDYAREQNVHGAILSWLTIHPEEFYRVELGDEETAFVTARGWEDLSALVQAYEALDVPVTEDVIRQYLQHEAAARRFAAYYRLYRQYDMDYDPSGILAGTTDVEARISMASQAGMEERYTVVNLLGAALDPALSRYAREDEAIVALHDGLVGLKSYLNHGSLDAFLEERRQALTVRETTGVYSAAQRRREDALLRRMEEYRLVIRREHIAEEAIFDRVRQLFQLEVERRRTMVEDIQGQLQRGFAFLERAFGDGGEVLMFVSALAHSEAAMCFIRSHGCEPFLKHSAKLLYKEQEAELQERCRAALQKGETT